MRDLLRAVFFTTATIELVGAGLLSLAFVRTHTVPQALWLAVFHEDIRRFAKQQ
jgi:hypothetical protein